MRGRAQGPWPPRKRPQTQNRTIPLCRGMGEDMPMATRIQAIKAQVAAKTAEADEWSGEVLTRWFLDAKTDKNGAPAKARTPRKGGGGTSNEKCQK